MVSPGTVLGGRYRLDERIAGGGMGEVWKGSDEVLGRTVAVKVLLPSLLEDPGFVERFRGEARTMATINHPGVVDIYDYGSDHHAGAYLIMEYVEGDALSRTLARVGRLTPARTMALVAQAADALQAAHDKGIVHRDVKPGNLLVRPNGSLVLTDFGIARSAMVAQLTAAGSVLGTASYISPEQAAGGKATPLSDVYALGVVAYQCLSGRRPFEGENPLEIAMRHVREQPPPLPADIPPPVRAVVDRAMAKDPAARFPSAAALGQVARRTAAVLATASAGGVAGPLPSPTSPGLLTGPGSPVVPRSPMIPSGGRMAPTGYPTGPTGLAGPTGVGGVPGSPAPTGIVGPGLRPGMPPGVPPRPGAPISGPPPGSGAPVGPIPHTAPGGYHRGAAAVPAPVPRGETGYLPPGATVDQPDNGRLRAVLMGLLIGVLLLIVVIGVLYLVTRKTGDPNAGARTGTSAPADPGTTRPTNPVNPANQAGGNSPAAAADVGCDKLRGRPVKEVSTELAKRGYNVDQRSAPGVKSRVLDVTPCRAAPGDTITLTVGNGSTGTTVPSPTQSGCIPGIGGVPVIGCPTSPSPGRS
jgi:hypothetical protein